MKPQLNRLFGQVVANPSPRMVAAPLPPKAAAPSKRILIVDDDPIVLKALTLKLESRGYRVTSASSGSQALNLARHERPDLVLLDVSFPPELGGVDWDGFRLTQWLRRSEEAPDLPVIVISGSERAEYRQRALALGAAGFLPKSISAEGLVACIELALSRKRAGNPAAAILPEDGGAGNATAVGHGPSAQPRRSDGVNAIHLGIL
jgi:CheY-like chemotaxis protein